MYNCIVSLQWLKSYVMKKLILIVGIALLSVCSVSAEEGDMAAGIDLSYGSEANSLGIGAEFQYGISDVIRGELSFDYFIQNDGMSMWNIDLAGHYLFDLDDNVTVYPLLGLTFVRVNYDLGSLPGSDFDDGYVEDEEWGSLGRSISSRGVSISAGESKLGVVFGGGVDYSLTESVSLGAELKYSLVNTYDQLVLSVGAKYKF